MNDATGPVGDEPWLAPDAEAADDAAHPGEMAPDLVEGDDPPPRFEADPRLAAFERIDWPAWAASDPRSAAAAWRDFQGLAAGLEAEAQAGRSARLEQVHAELAREIEGWSPELAADLARYGESRGFTAEELAAVEDPREIKILHLAMIGEQALAQAGRDRAQAQRFAGIRPPTQAGDLDLQTPGKLMCGRRVRGATLVFSDVDVWAAQYLGGVAVYGFQRVGADCGVVAKGAAVSLDTRAVWMGRGTFFTYDGGSVGALECEVADHVFGDLNDQQISKVSAWHNAGYGEVWWHYPSAGSNENDRYAAWSYRTGKWSVGELARTCGTSAGVFPNPLLMSPAGEVWEHEVGWAWGDSDEESERAVPFARSAPLELGAGDRVMAVAGLVGDEKTLGQAEVRFFARGFPNAGEIEHGPYALTTAPADARFSARQVETQVEFTRETDSRVGVMRLDVRPVGRR